MKKTININKQLHDDFKKYCVNNGITISNLVELLIKKEMSGSTLIKEHQNQVIK